MSSKKVFSVNDKVFAKIRGYPAWPAMVSGVKTDSPSRMRYNVYFYGTGERAECKPEDLCPYEENKARLGKPNKRKYFAEALLQIEDSSGTLVLPDEDTEMFTTPSDTSTVEQVPLVDCAVDDTEVEKANESNSESEKKLTVDKSSLPKAKKDIGLKKSLGLSKGTKRKISDNKPEASGKKSFSNKSKTSEISKLKKNQTDPIVLVETLNDSLLEKAFDNVKQNTETTDKNVIADEKVPEKTDNKLTETLNTTIESSAIKSISKLSLDTSKTTKSVSKVKDSPSSSSEMSSVNSSNVGHVSRSGRKIKPKKYSDYENDSEVPKRSRTSKENSKTFEKQSNSTEIDNSSDQIVKPKDTVSNAESKKTPKTPVVLINDTTAGEIEHISNQIKAECGLPEALKEIMIEKLSDLETKWKKTAPSKAENIEMLHTEIDLLDNIHKLRLALRIDTANYDIALDMLEQISELQIKPLTLKKHQEVVETIRKVTKYVGNPEEWKLSEEDAINHTEKASQIRRKADVVLNKFASLFTIPDGQLFDEYFEKEAAEFFLKTKNLSCEEIYGMTSENLN